eukprot:scaffold103900_cov63-Phaeocystis_antarctica.AAC.2
MRGYRRIVNCELRPPDKKNDEAAGGTPPCHVRRRPEHQEASGPQEAPPPPRGRVPVRTQDGAPSPDRRLDCLWDRVHPCKVGIDSLLCTCTPLYV